MAPNRSWVAAIMAEMNAAHEDVREMANLPGRLEPGSEASDRWIAACQRVRDLRNGEDGSVAEMRRGVVAGDATAIDHALEYLEADPYYWRSGYLRAELARRLGMHAAAMDASQAERARAVALGWVDGTLHPGHTGAARLARGVANNSLRRALRARLHNRDQAIAYRAAMILGDVKHPGYTAQDLARARSVILDAMSSRRWSRRSEDRAALRLWSPEWESELRDIAAVHGPQRAVAKQLLSHVDRSRERRKRRAGP
jgi:hypothetical protein